MEYSIIKLDCEDKTDLSTCPWNISTLHNKWHQHWFFPKQWVRRQLPPDTLSSYLYLSLSLVCSAKRRLSYEWGLQERKQGYKTSLSWGSCEWKLRQVLLWMSLIDDRLLGDVKWGKQGTLGRKLSKDLILAGYWLWPEPRKNNKAWIIPQVCVYIGWWRLSTYTP